MATTVTTECPRCGYDLQGVVTSWREQCPTAGACAECGLAFDWREVLNPSHRVPSWSLEAKRSPLARPRQFAAALLHVFWPRRYWSAIVMTHPIRWRRLAGFCAVALLFVGGGLMLLAAAHAVRDHRATTSFGATSPDGDAIVFGRMLWSPLSGAPVSGYTWTRPKDGTVFTYAGPTCAWYTRHLWSIALPFLMATFLSVVFTALAFAVLPQSRRRAKVRARHIVRVAFHGLLVPIVVLGVAGIAAVLPVLRGAEPPPWVAVLTLGLMTVGTLAWWQAASLRYLRMEHSWAVATATTVIGLLAPIVLYTMVRSGV
jgi:hypothetical protein